MVTPDSETTDRHLSTAWKVYTNFDSQLYTVYALQSTNNPWVLYTLYSYQVEQKKNTQKLPNWVSSQKETGRQQPFFWDDFFQNGVQEYVPLFWSSYQDNKEPLFLQWGDLCIVEETQSHATWHPYGRPAAAIVQSDCQRRVTIWVRKEIECSNKNKIPGRWQEINEARNLDLTCVASNRNSVCHRASMLLYCTIMDVSVALLSTQCPHCTVTVLTDTLGHTQWGETFCVHLPDNIP